MPCCNVSTVSRNRCSGGVRLHPQHRHDQQQQLSRCTAQTHSSSASPAPCRCLGRMLPCRNDRCRRVRARLASLGAYAPIAGSTVRRRIRNTRRRRLSTAIGEGIAMSFERPWLARVSAGGCGRDRCGRVPVRRRRAGERDREVSRSSGLRQPRQDPHLRRNRPAQRAVRGLPARRAEAQEGRSRRDHDAQLPAVPDRHLRRAARRADGGQHQSDVHRARAQAPAGRLRRQRDPGARQFRPHRAGSARRHAGQAGHHHRPGRHARLPEGRDRQLRAASTSRRWCRTTTSPAPSASTTR